MPTVLEILVSLDPLKQLLRKAIDRAEKASGIAIGDDPFLGLSVDSDTAKASLRHGQSLILPLELEEWKKSLENVPYYQSLKKNYASLSEIDFGLLLLAMAPEIGDAYERVFGFLQDDVTRRRASVDLATKLFDPTSDSSVVAALGHTGTLIKNRLVELAEPSDGRTGWSSKILRLDEQFARWMFGNAALDSRLTSVAELSYPGKDDTSFVAGSLRAQIERLIAVKPFRLFLHGPDARLHLRLAKSLAARVNRSLLIVDLKRLTGNGTRIAETVETAVREARWFQHLLVFTDADGMGAPDRLKSWEQFTAAIERTASAEFVILGGSPILPPTSDSLRVMSFDVPMPDSNERFEIWSSILESFKVALPTVDRDVLANRYTLTRTQIELAAAEGVTAAKQRSALEQKPVVASFDDLSIAARSQGGQDLETLTSKISPRIRLDDVVVPEDIRAQLNEVVSRVLNRNWVLRDWGFARRQSYGLGVNALFAGPPGTGKTMAAEALAHALGKDLYKIDLTSVVSKYIGETEQKLEQIFRAGEATQAVLFFDEADSLLGKRSEVKDAHDRYANLEVSYLLQRMERYDGLIILATNLPGNLDEAFLRRMAAIVHFPQPSAAERRILWRKAWPSDSFGNISVPLAKGSGSEIDFDYLAERFELTGGNIRNAVIAAAFAAAGRAHFRFVTMADVLLGVRREFQKLGQMMSDAELGLDRFPVPLDPPPKIESLRVITAPTRPIRTQLTEIGGEA